MDKVKKIPCPCGCSNFLVPPVINCQCGTLDAETADFLVAAWNEKVERETKKGESNE